MYSLPVAIDVFVLMLSLCLGLITVITFFVIGLHISSLITKTVLS